MKKICSTARATISAIAATFAFAANMFAAPLDTHGIPAAAAGVVHIDFDALAKTRLGTPAQDIFDLAWTFEIGWDALSETRFKEKTGFNPKTDLRGITIGIMPPDEISREVAKKIEIKEMRNALLPASIIMIFRGKFSQEKWNAFFQERFANNKTKFSNMRFSKEGRHQVFTNGYGSLVVADENTLVFTLAPRPIVETEKELSPVCLKTVLDAFDGITKSRPPPAASQLFGKETETPAIQGFCDLTVFEISPMDAEKWDSLPAPLNVSAAIFVSGETVRLRSSAQLATESDARLLSAKAQVKIASAQAFFAKQNKLSEHRKTAESGDSEHPKNLPPKTMPHLVTSNPPRLSTNPIRENPETPRACVATPLRKRLRRPPFRKPKSFSLTCNFPPRQLSPTYPPTIPPLPSSTSPKIFSLLPDSQSNFPNPPRPPPPPHRPQMH